MRFGLWPLGFGLWGWGLGVSVSTSIQAPLDQRNVVGVHANALLHGSRRDDEV